MAATPLGPQNYYLGKGVMGVITNAPLINRWQATTAYALGDQVLNFNPSPTGAEFPYSVYVCSTAGTSASSGGPTGTTTAIADGVTLKWDYVPFVGIGNTSGFSTKMTDTREDHQTSQSGAVNTDMTFLTKRKGEMELTIEEYTIENLALANFGTIGGTSPHRFVTFGGALPANVALQFVGTGAYGKHFQVIIPRFQLIPDKIEWISEKQAKMSLKGDVYGVPNDSFTLYYGAEIA
jgi:hypothetical protein